MLYRVASDYQSREIIMSKPVWIIDDDRSIRWVLEKALAVGMGGMLATDVRMALSGLATPVHTVIAGLGGRSITQGSVARMLNDAEAGTLPALSFLDLDEALVGRVLERERQTRLSGPIAEGILRDLGSVASRIV